MSDRNNMCFACGKDNSIGLKLSFFEKDGRYISKFVAAAEHQGYDGIVHGGIVSTLLDEIMAGYIYFKGLNGVTGRLEIRYHCPTPLGEELSVEGWVVRERGKLYEMAGEIKLPDGTVSASGKATIVVVKSE